MEKRRTMTLGLTVLSVVAIAVLLWAAGSATASPPTSPRAQGGAPLLLNYQGRLADPTTGLAKPDGTYNIVFRIWGAETGGALVWSKAQVVTVTRGLFNVLLGSITPLSASDFDGTSRWLELEVDGETLSPRMRLGSVPYAIQAEEAKNAWRLTGNAGTTGSSFLGTTDNQALELRVNNARALRLEPNATSPNLVGGYSGNSVTASVVGATVGGGGSSGSINEATANYGTVGGGASNTASGTWSTVGGGQNNTAGGGLTYGSATVGGGQDNTASGLWATIGGGLENIGGGETATVGGGYRNIASAIRATVSGGMDNTASGWFATVPGGGGNTAQGQYSFAAGRRAKANHDGAFVWADSTDADVSSTANDQFLVRASGNVGINTNAPGSTLTVSGTIESTSGGFKFPDGTMQTTAATGGGDITAVYAGTGLTGGGDTGDVTLSLGGTYRLPQTCTDGQVAEWNDITSQWECSSVIQPTSFWSLTGNAGTDSATNFLGTTDEVSLTLAVSGTAALRLEPNATSPNLVGGYSGNSVTSGVKGATIGGGGQSGYTNRVTDDYGTVGGGENNQAGDNSGTTSDRSYATIGGGQGNTASGYAATVPGGMWNRAAGPYSFAGGSCARADHDGMFVWSGVSYLQGTQCFPSTREYNFTPSSNQFLVRATGGAVIVTAIDSPFGTSIAGVKVGGGSGTWSSLSNRNAKANIDPVDEREILKRLAQIPISTWNYKSQKASIRHIGPMAGDFYAAFGVGEDDKFITTVDADGVALAAIQGLYHIVQKQDAQIATQQRRIEDLEARVVALEQRLNTGRAAASSTGLPTLWPLLAGLPLLGLVLGWRQRRGGGR